MPSSNASGDLSKLTRREVEVLHLVADRRDIQSVADELFVSTWTVRRHIANIRRKLNLSEN